MVKTQIEEIRQRVTDLLVDRHVLHQQTAFDRRAPRTLAQRFDHTLLKVEARREDYQKLFKEAAEYGCYSVCVPPRVVAQAVRTLTASGVRVCTVIGFPAGYATTAGKVKEALQCREWGAHEFDMVLPIGELKDGDMVSVYEDVRAVVGAVEGAIVKVILETCYLTDEEKVAAGASALCAGAAFLKTSTGFGTGGATIADVKLLRALAGDQAGVKAAGGIRDRSTAEAFVAAGADRIGSSSTVGILTGR